MGIWWRRSRSEYWKSNAKFFCRFCKIYITDNKSTRNIHDQGSKHKENVERFLREQNQRGRDREAEAARMDKQMDAIEKAAMKQYQLDVEAGLVQPSAAMKAAQTKETEATATPPAKESEPTPTGLLKVSSSKPTPAPTKPATTEESEEGKTETGSTPEPAAPLPVKIKDETVGQPGEWQTVEVPVSSSNKSSQQNKKEGSDSAAVDDDEDVAGNPEDLRQFRIVEKTYPVDDDLVGEDDVNAGSAVFKKRKGGVGKQRNIRRKL
ncbi:hypothetical protein BGX29_005297 [Mortierella sp. GBA35]|nr:hypothetical protein BGX29_005297 [Mortierella sp. GBA35]